ncbi:CDGSH iron-sulfur domain-containing protein [Saccharopolyspora hordei]|uniref:CDGSH iron-sulfur domain-containing protein n=1 Tax=Saccharopolyspora hordei TaxID=1838 RepID=UPI0031B5AEAA
MTEPTARYRADWRRVRIVPGGPVLIDGPVDIVTGDGTTHSSDRVVVALCACRRSHRFPFCDTSHRRRVRRTTEPDAEGSAQRPEQ